MMIFRDEYSLKHRFPHTFESKIDQYEKLGKREKNYSKYLS